MKTYRKYSVFRERGLWTAQVLRMPEEDLIRARSFGSQSEARLQVRVWRAGLRRIRREVLF